MQINKFNFLLGKKIIETENIKTQIELSDNEGISLKFDDNSKLMF